MGLRMLKVVFKDGIKFVLADTDIYFTSETSQKVPLPAV